MVRRSGTWLGAGATLYAVISAMRMSQQQIETQRALTELEMLSSDLRRLERQNEIFEDVKQSIGMVSLFCDSAIGQLKANKNRTAEQIMQYVISNVPIFKRLPENEYGGCTTPPEWSALNWLDREQIALALNKLVLAANMVGTVAGDENARREFSIKYIQRFFSDEIEIDKTANDCRDEYLKLSARRAALKESLFARGQGKLPYRPL